MSLFRLPQSHLRCRGATPGSYVEKQPAFASCEMPW